MQPLLWTRQQTIILDQVETVEPPGRQAGRLFQHLDVFWRDAAFLLCVCVSSCGIGNKPGCVLRWGFLLAFIPTIVVFLSRYLHMPGVSFAWFSARSWYYILLYCLFNRLNSVLGCPFFYFVLRDVLNRFAWVCCESRWLFYTRYTYLNDMHHKICDVIH